MSYCEFPMRSNVVFDVLDSMEFVLRLKHEAVDKSDAERK
jgi:hypothetical protein